LDLQHLTDQSVLGLLKLHQKVRLDLRHQLDLVNQLDRLNQLDRQHQKVQLDRLARSGLELLMPNQ
jgi:hypothetical protein